MAAGNVGGQALDLVWGRGKLDVVPVVFEREAVLVRSTPVLAEDPHLVPQEAECCICDTFEAPVTSSPSGTLLATRCDSAGVARLINYMTLARWIRTVHQRCHRCT